MDKRAESFLRLLKIMDELREECPWDKVQTKESIRHLSIEEVYELSDAILKDDYQNIKEELGDLLLHIVFYSKMANEKNKFNITDVANAICDKLIERHPHIYGDEKASDPESVKQNWEKIKLKGKSPKTSVLDGVPSSMPPIVKAMRMQDKAAQVGFDWENKEQVWAKVEEELNEFKEASNSKDREQEFGDLLFSLINFARFEKISPDDALSKTNVKFFNRFTYIEKKARENNKALDSMTLEEMDSYWEEAKQFE